MRLKMIRTILEYQKSLKSSFKKTGLNFGLMKRLFINYFIDTVCAIFYVRQYSS